MATPLHFDMTLPNGQPLRWDMPGARWDGTVEEVMAALNQNHNMNTNKFSAVLTPADRDTAIGHINSIKTLFPFLQGLTTDQKKRIKRAGDKRLPFIQKAYTYAAQHPEVLPGTFSLTEFNKDIVFINTYAVYLAALKAHYEIAFETNALAESDGYDQARDVYDFFKRNNRNGEYDAIVADLATTFENQGPNPPPAPPTP